MTPPKNCIRTSRRRCSLPKSGVTANSRASESRTTTSSATKTLWNFIYNLPQRRREPLPDALCLLEELAGKGSCQRVKKGARMGAPLQKYLYKQPIYSSFFNLYPPGTSNLESDMAELSTLVTSVVIENMKLLFSTFLSSFFTAFLPIILPSLPMI